MQPHDHALYDRMLVLSAGAGPSVVGEGKLRVHWRPDGSVGLSVTVKLVWVIVS